LTVTGYPVTLTNDYSGMMPRELLALPGTGSVNRGALRVNTIVEASSRQLARVYIQRYPVRSDTHPKSGDPNPIPTSKRDM
jgi:hypothetical protein